MDENGSQGLIEIDLQPSAGLDHRQDHRPKLSAAMGLAEETDFAPDHIGTQGSFRCIVGERHAWKGQEGPQLGEILQQFAAAVTGFVPAMDQGGLFQVSLEDVSESVQSPSVVATLVAALLPAVGTPDHQTGNPQ